ncbi:MAG TPA: nuclear transport factor 2 family protein [Acidimicrobiales bacterium]|nr:nuclear transport factor 2 family protein [Acidimicrobiales bacterium]
MGLFGSYLERAGTDPAGGTGDQMEGMEGYPDRAARRVAIQSMRAVESGDREGWLALFTDDAIVQDPIGPSPLDPSGEGHRGRDAIAAFYDNIVSQGRISFRIRESYVAGDECANVGTITTAFPDGSRVVVEGVYTYRTDGGERLTALRAFWDYEAAKFEPAPG